MKKLKNNKKNLEQKTNVHINQDADIDEAVKAMAAEEFGSYKMRKGLIKIADSIFINPDAITFVEINNTPDKGYFASFGLQGNLLTRESALFTKKNDLLEWLRDWLSVPYLYNFKKENNDV